jgi:hypothetical protein
MNLFTNYLGKWNTAPAKPASCYALSASLLASSGTERNQRWNIMALCTLAWSAWSSNTCKANQQGLSQSELHSWLTNAERCMLYKALGIQGCSMKGGSTAILDQHLFHSYFSSHGSTGQIPPLALGMGT